MNSPNGVTDRHVAAAIDEIYRTESRRVLATLIRLLGDFDLGEEALQEAFVAATRQWPVDGVPRNPRAWLISTGRFRTIDRLRRSNRRRRALRELVERETRSADSDKQPIADDRLRLIFTCCHPDLSPDARIALTLREVCGVATEAIARAFLIKTATVAQRIVRAKVQIRDRRIRYAVPEPEHWSARLASVLRVVYLVYTTGYAAGAREEARSLCVEAVRLARLVHELVSDDEATGLLALMVLQESRRTARFTADGDVVLLAAQNRALWDHQLIAEGRRLAAQVSECEPIGPYAIQAAIAAVHAGAESYNDTDWNKIVRWYDLLTIADPSPVVGLNRAAAVGMRDGPEAGLASLADVERDGALGDYYLLHAAKADALRRLGRNREALGAYRRALATAANESDRRFLERRIRDVRASV